MEVLKTYRHEYKYIISYADMLALRKKLDKVLTVDRNEDGYLIRSMYFDSTDDDDYYDKLGGELNRKKVRLRIYEPNSNYVKLEIKYKNDIHQLKKSIIIDKMTAIAIINENIWPIIVASAPPFTPILNLIMNNKSIITLIKDDKIRKYRGVLLSPNALIMFDAKL